MSSEQHLLNDFEDGGSADVDVEGEDNDDEYILEQDLDLVSWGGGSSMPLVEQQQQHSNIYIHNGSIQSQLAAADEDIHG